MQGASVFRRAFHLASPIFLGFYLVPEALAPGLTRNHVTWLFLGTAWCIEIARIALDLQLFGMRAYEGRRVSAYAQGSIGLAFALFFIQDPRIVVPAFLGMAWIDPLAAFSRKRRWPVVVPIAAYAAVFFAATTLVGAFLEPWPVDVRIGFTALATTTALLVEGPRVPQLDDDLLMQVVPMTILWALASAL